MPWVCPFPPIFCINSERNTGTREGTPSKPPTDLRGESCNTPSFLQHPGDNPLNPCREGPLPMPVPVLSAGAADPLLPFVAPPPRPHPPETGLESGRIRTPRQLGRVFMGTKKSSRWGGVAPPILGRGGGGQGYPLTKIGGEAPLAPKFREDQILKPKNFRADS